MRGVETSMRTLPMLCVALLMAGHGVAAQTRTDFSGRWVLENAPDASGATAIELIVQQVELTTSGLGRALPGPITYLTVERHFATEKRIDRYQPVGLVGGVVEGLSGQRGTLTTTMQWATKWEGEVLVISRTERGETRDERWSLDAEGSLIVLATTRANGSESTTRLVYRRQ
jgi:hypothetical protein